MVDVPPVEPDYSGLTDEEATAVLRVYNDATAAYTFKFSWLPQAVGAREYLAVMGLPGSYLEELYPWVAMFGPLGNVWEKLLTRLAVTLDGVAAGQVQAVAALRDFIRTYGDPAFFKAAMRTPAAHQSPVISNLARDTTAWGVTNDICVDTWRGSQLLIEIDELAEPLILRVVDHPVWPRVISDTSMWVDGGLSKARLLNTFSGVVLVRDLLTREPAFERDLHAHQAFLDRWGWV